VFWFVLPARGFGRAFFWEVVVVSAVPELNGGRPVASIVLLKGERLSTVSEPLD